MKKVLAFLLTMALMPAMVFAQQGAKPGLKPLMSDAIEVDFSFFSGLHMFVDNQHTTVENSAGATISDTTKNNFINTLGPASEFKLLVKYGSMAIQLGLKPFANTPLGESHFKYYLDKNERLELGIIANMAHYTFGQMTLGKQLEDYGNIAKQIRQGVSYYNDNWGIALITGNGAVNTSLSEIDPAVSYFQGTLSSAASATTTNTAMQFNPINNAPTGAKIAVRYNNIPRLEGMYNFDFGSVKTKLYGSYSIYDLQSTVNGKVDNFFAHAAFAGVGNNIKAGPGVIKSNVFAGMNMMLIEAFSPRMPGSQGPLFDVNSDNTLDINNAIAWGVTAEYGQQLSKKLRAHIGAGTMSNEVDGNNKRFTYATYVNVVYIPFPGFAIVPEVGYNHQETTTRGTKTNLDSITYGVRFSVFSI